MLRSVRHAAATSRTLLRARPWRPSHLGLLLRDLGPTRTPTGTNDHTHLRAAVDWVKAAQDSQTDGGIAGRYSMETGWSSSYPETTGYWIPTMLRVARALGDDDLRRRAERCVEFLLAVQLGSGGFPGGEVADGDAQPSVFNTAQVLCGLDAWFREAADEDVLAAGRRAADWLVDVQDDDGAWRRHTWRGLALAYYAHAACWLARLGTGLDERRYRDAAAAHLDWTLACQDQLTGWFVGQGFPDQREQDIAMTHTIGYTLWGVLECSAHLDREDGLDAVRRAAGALSARIADWGRLPGTLGPDWSPRARYTCLTGNAQVGQMFCRLYELDREPQFKKAAHVALRAVKAAQLLRSSDPAIKGGVPGSRPAWGDYLPFTLPSWAPKFLIDALLEPGWQVRSV